MKIADRFALLYKPIRDESDIMAILTMTKLIVYVPAILTLIAAFDHPELVAASVYLFLLGYSLPRKKSRLVSVLTIYVFLVYIFFSFRIMTFSAPPFLHWLTIIVFLIPPLFLLLHFLGAWLALRSLRQPFFTTE
jgi:apolipoprotein N-acyltransferase